MPRYARLRCNLAVSLACNGESICPDLSGPAWPRTRAFVGLHPGLRPRSDGVADGWRPGDHFFGASLLSGPAQTFLVGECDLCWRLRRRATVGERWRPQGSHEGAAMDAALAGNHLPTRQRVRRLD